MKRRILIGCYEIPGYGGASTATYKLFEVMQNDGIDVHFVNLIDEQDKDFFSYTFGNDYGNPKTLANVHNHVLKQSLYKPHPRLEELIKKINPDVLIGVGYIAALLMKKAAMDRKVIFLASGCSQVKEYLARKLVPDVITLKKFVEKDRIASRTYDNREKEAIALSDFVITHSKLNKYLYQFFYLSHSEKIYSKIIWYAEWIYKDALDYEKLKRPFSERELDVLFISSSWDRPEKNYKMLKKITSKCNNVKFHIVGETQSSAKNAVHHGLVTERNKVFSLLGNCKTVVSLSPFDAAPGILFEGAAMGCNLVASKNCGNWEICNKDLLVDPFSGNMFIKRIKRSLEKKFNDNIEYFLKTNSYSDLTEVISVF